MSNTTKQFIVTWIVLITLFGWTSWHECEHGSTPTIGKAADVWIEYVDTASVITILETQKRLFGAVLTNQKAISTLQDARIAELELDIAELALRNNTWDNSDDIDTGLADRTQEGRIGDPQ